MNRNCFSYAFVVIAVNLTAYACGFSTADNAFTLIFCELFVGFLAFEIKTLIWDFDKNE